jgi:predicted dehydrogenase
MLMNDSGLGVAVIGAGYWGPNLLRNFCASGRWSVRALCDLDPARLDKAVAPYPGLWATTDLLEVLEDPRIDAIAIATPAETHFTIADAALRAGKHVLIEKPMTTSVPDAEALCRTAERLGRILMVDHTYLFCTPVEYLKAAQERGDFGDLLYLDAVRVNLGLFQQFANVVVDLAPHDVSIINYLLDAVPHEVSTAVSRCMNTDIVDVAYVSLRYPRNVMAHVHLSWLSPVKMRRMSIAGRNKMAVWDDLETDRVKVYDKGVVFPADAQAERLRHLVNYRLGDMVAPALTQREALEKVVAEFHDAITERRTPRSSGRFGLDVVRVLDGIERSIAAEGRAVSLEAVAA